MAKRKNKNKKNNKKTVEQKVEVQPVVEKTPNEKIEETPKENKPLLDTIVDKAVDDIKEKTDENKIANDKMAKGVIVAVALLFLVVIIYFIGNGKTETQTDTTNIKVNVNVSDLLTDNTKQEILSQTSIDETSISDYINEDTVSVAGVELPSAELTVYGGEQTINLADYKGKKVILEVIADWCTYCQQMSSKYLDDIVATNKDEFVFIQYMQTGSKEEVDTFYSTIGKDHNSDVTIVYQNSDMDSWLYENNFNSYPSFYMFNEEGKNVGMVTGLIPTNEFNSNFLPLFYNTTPLYEVKTTDGLSLSETLRLQAIAYDYMNSLEEIDVPNSYIESYNK